MDNLKINYDLLEQQRATEVQKDLKNQLKRLNRQGSDRIDSLRSTILHYVVASDYKMAHSELKRYVEELGDYPSFAFRTHRYIKHAVDLINAIKAKRNFPGLSSLSKSKQQELVERVVDHFDELREYLKKVEKIEKELKLEDMRSTVWVVKTFFNSIFAVLIILFIYDLSTGLGSTFLRVFNDFISTLMSLSSGILF